MNIDVSRSVEKIAQVEDNKNITSSRPYMWHMHCQ